MLDGQFLSIYHILTERCVKSLQYPSSSPSFSAAPSFPGSNGFRGARAHIGNPLNQSNNISKQRTGNFSRMCDKMFSNDLYLVSMHTITWIIIIMLSNNLPQTSWEQLHLQYQILFILIVSLLWWFLWFPLGWFLMTSVPQMHKCQRHYLVLKYLAVVQ